ncbi:MAG: VIT1/CCC1 transporter family protein [Salibacteraceae bacterium]|jgi:hypothetical protein|nr:VIT1/CCC1 transporter family protein [Salibacteraceae bacterium]
MSIVLMLSLFACSSSNDVVSNRLIQKRKYQKGFHLNGLAHKKNIKSELETGEVAELNAPERLSKLQSDRIGKPSVYAKNELSADDRLPNSVEIENRKVSPFSNHDLVKLAIQPKKFIKNIPSITSRWYDGIEPDNKSSNGGNGSISLLLSLMAFVVTFLTFLLGVFIPFIPFVFLFGILVGLTLAIVAVAVGANHRRNNDVAKAGFILGWVYLVLVSVFILLTILFVILLIAAFSA